MFNNKSVIYKLRNDISESIKLFEGLSYEDSEINECTKDIIGKLKEDLELIKLIEEEL